MPRVAPFHQRTISIGESTGRPVTLDLGVYPLPLRPPAAIFAFASRPLHRPTSEKALASDNIGRLCVCFGIVVAGRRPRAELANRGVASFPGLAPQLLQSPEDARSLLRVRLISGSSSRIRTIGAVAIAQVRGLVAKCLDSWANLPRHHRVEWRGLLLVWASSGSPPAMPCDDVERAALPPPT